MNAHILDTIDMYRLGRELQRARKRKGLTQEQAAQLIGATRTTMVAIEKGDRRIKAGELVTLAEAYDTPVHDLVRSRPDVEALGVQFRGPFISTDDDQRDIGPAIQEFEDLCRNYLELELLTESPLVRKYPAEYDFAGQPLEATAEAIALEERTRLGLGDGPIPLLRDILEQDVGLRIFYVSMPRKYSEIYAYADELGGCIAVNRVHPEERRRWSLAHGYFHFLATRHAAEIELLNGYLRQPEAERFADAFARYFLMPTAGLTRRFNDIQRKGKVTPAALCTVAHFYGVSHEGLTRRLESMRLLPSGTWEKLGGIKWRELRDQLGLDAIPTSDQKVPMRYTYLALEALQQGLIGEEQFARFLDVTRLAARRIASDMVSSASPSASAQNADGNVSASAPVDEQE